MLQKWAFFWFLSMLLALDVRSEEQNPDLPMVNTELGLSLVVNNCVNVISGDYVQASMDLVVAGPEPLAFERTYASSDYASRSLYNGWRHSFDSRIVLTDMCPLDNSFKANYTDFQGRTFAVWSRWIKPQVGKPLPITCKSNGYTNCGSGIISGRTNPHNMILTHYEAKKNKMEVTHPSGSRLEFDRVYENLFHLSEEKRSNNHKLLLSYKYEFDKDFDCHIDLVKEVTLRGNHTDYSWIKLNYQKNKHLKHENLRNLQVQGSNGQEITYKLQKFHGHKDPAGKRTRYYISEVDRSYAPKEEFQYADRSGDPGQAIIKKSIEGKCVQYVVYYKKEPGDEKNYRIDRVKEIWEPLGTDDKLHKAYSVEYRANDVKKKKNEKDEVKSGYTDVFDFYRNKTTYKYNSKHRLDSVKRFSGKENTLFSKEKYEWAENGTDEGNLLSTYLTDGLSKVISGRAFKYDEHFNIATEKFFGNITGTGNAIVWNGYDTSNCDTYAKRYSYDALHRMESEKEDNGRSVKYGYEKNSDRLAHKFIREHKKICVRYFYEYDANGVLNTTIIDDGTTTDKNNLTGVTERRITRIHPKLAHVKNSPDNSPIGTPTKIEEFYVDLATGAEKLLKSVSRKYSVEGYLLEEIHQDRDRVERYRLTWKYDAHGNVERETNALGEIIVREFDKRNNLTSEELLGSGHCKKYEYDLCNRRTQCTHVLKDGTLLITKYRYDFKGNCFAIVDPCGQVTESEYDAFGRVTSITSPAIPNEQGELIPTKISKKYDVQGNVIALTDQRSETFETSYNVYGKPTQIKYPDGSQETFTYNLDGTLRSSVEKNGLMALYTHDCFGRQLSKELRAPDGTIISRTSSTYNAFHLKSSTDAEGHVTTYRYDGAGRLIATAKEGALTTLEYDALGRPYKTCEWYGSGNNTFRATIKTYDYLDRVLEECVEDGQQPGVSLRLTKYQYDCDGNVISLSQKTSAGMAATLTKYDALKKPIEITNPMGETTHIVYKYHARNAYGQEVLETIQTDPLGNLTITTYNTLGKPGSIVKKNAFDIIIAKKELFYNGIGDCQSTVETVFTPGASDRTVTTCCMHNFHHQLCDLFEAEGTPEQKHTQYIYNDYGQKEAIIKPDGTKILHTYDVLGRLHNFTASDNSFSYTYTYDRNDKPIAIVDNLHGTQTVRVYDASEQLEKEILDSGLTVQYTYDRLGRPIQTILPDQSFVEYLYDASNLKKISRKDCKGVLRYEHQYLAYDGTGRAITVQLPGAAGTIQYQYDLLGRLVQAFSQGREESYAYDAVGNLIAKAVQQDGEGVEQDFAYDDLYQLKSESGAEAHVYECDSLYNCVNKDGSVRIFNALNQLLSQGETVYGYDLNGNLISKTAEGEVTEYTYDALDRLIQVNAPNQTVFYTYDAFNRRISKQVESDGSAAVIEMYLYQGQNEVGSCNSEGEMTQFRLLGTGKGAEIGATTAIEIGLSVSVPLHDQNGNIVILLDLATGNVQESYRFSAFGEEQIFDAEDNVLNGSAVGNPWRFSSKRVDEETGFVYFGRRYYDPQTIRWVTPDPIGFDGGPNLYAYVLNNPLTLFDLYGLVGTNENVRTSWGFDQSWSNPGRWISEALVLPGKVLSFVSTHLIPIPYVSGFVSAVGNFFAGQWPAWEPMVHSRSEQVGTGGRDPHHETVTINGMNNSYYDAKGWSLSISAALGGRSVSMIYNSTRGTFFDLGECGVQTLGAPTYVVDEAVRELRAATERVGPDGIVDVIAHSQGGLILARALEQLNPEERSRIYAHTFGTARIIDPNKFGLMGAQNYINTRDAVPFIADPIGYIKAWITRPDHVTFVNSNGIPFIDHTIENYEESFQTAYKQINGRSGGRR